jgi:hypothetical protein
MNAESVATTESLFRDVNERIAESVQRFDGDGDAQFVCECADSTCTEQVSAPMKRYDQVREDPTHFLLAPGHEDERIERVIERRRRYQVVEKFHGAIAARVRRLDPRRKGRG